jgi:hypothetical protein
MLTRSVSSEVRTSDLEHQLSVDFGDELEGGIDQKIELIRVDIMQCDIDAGCGCLRKYEC